MIFTVGQAASKTGFLKGRKEGRQGQRERVLIHHLVCAGTRDEDVMKALERKDGMQEWVMDSLKARIKAIRKGELSGL